MTNCDYDLAVIGGGSGGIGASLAGARLGLSTVLIEKRGELGGTSTEGGVNCWEMVAGGTGIPFDIYCRMKAIPNAVGVYSSARHCLWHDPASGGPPFPGGESVIDPTLTYVNSCRRCGARSMREDREFCREHWHGVVFEPDAFCRVVDDMLAESGKCDVLKREAFASVSGTGGHVDSITLADGRRIAARTYVDCTADVLVARAAGARTVLGQESSGTYDEPDAPEKATDRLNGTTLMFRASRARRGGIEELPPGVPSKCWWRSAFPVVCVNHYPCGDLSLNMLPTMEGVELSGMPLDAAYEECRRRVYAEWHHLQTIFPEFQDMRLSWIAPVLGIREGSRIIAEYVMTEHDLIDGLSGQTHGDVVAIADHAMDAHGSMEKRPAITEMREPHGIPFRCLVPRGFDNLLVACRGAGFSSLAASSCRLSRTMMQLGQAAGTAAAIAKMDGTSVRDVSVPRLRDSLYQQHVQLEWPMRTDLREYLASTEKSVGR